MDDGRIPVLPYKRPMGNKDFFRPYEYVYDNYYDCVICPENKILNYSTTNREGYREFKSKDIRHTPGYKVLYEKRKETIERVFADAKEKHSMRYTLYKGLAQVTNWVRLKFAAMNLKKYAMRKWDIDGKEHFYLDICCFFPFFHFA